MQKKPLLIFDFFGVIVEEVAHVWLRERVSSSVADHIISTLFVAVDEGRVTPEECFVALEELTKVPAETIRDDWYAIGKLRADTHKFLIENQDKYHIVLLSNAGTSFIMPFFTRDNTGHLFLKKFISSELKMAKPNPEIFQYVLNNSGVDYSFAVMIDDGIKNIAAAKALGIEGIVFENMDKTALELAKLVQKHY